MRRVGKQIVAITLAAAMMGSLTPEACTFLQNEVVYAAETNDVVYENSDKVKIEDMGDEEKTSSESTLIRNWKIVEEETEETSQS